MSWSARSLLILILMTSTNIFFTTARTASFRTRSVQKSQPNVDSKSQQQYLPKTLRSSDFQTLAKQSPRTPPSPPTLVEALGQVFSGDTAALTKIMQKLLKGQTDKVVYHTSKNTEANKPPKQTQQEEANSPASTPDESLDWIDAIASDSALQSLESATLQQLSQLSNKLARIRQARKRYVQQPKPSTPTQSTHANFQPVDMTEAIFGDQADHMRDLGVSVQVISFDNAVDLGDLLKSVGSDTDPASQALDNEEDATVLSFVPGPDGNLVMEEMQTNGDLKKALGSALKGLAGKQPNPADNPPNSAVLKDLLSKVMAETAKSKDHDASEPQVIDVRSAILDVSGDHASNDKDKHKSQAKTASRKVHKIGSLKDLSSGLGDFMKQLKGERDAALKELKGQGLDEKKIFEAAQQQVKAMLQQMMKQQIAPHTDKPDEDSNELLHL